MKKSTLTAQAILSSLKKKEYSPVYFLQGEETFFIDSISSYIEKNVLDEAEKDFNQVILYGKEIDARQVVDQARQFPMMAPYRVIIIREAQAMKDIRDLQPYVENPSPQSILVINYKYKTVDLRTAFAKALNKNGVLFTSKPLYENQVPGWIMNHASKYQLKISPESASLITEFLGSNLSKIDNELEKLSFIVGKDHQLSLDEVKEHIGQSKDYNVFELNNAIAEKNIVKANRIIQYFAANPKSTHITLVIGNLYSFFSKVLIVEEHLSQDDLSISKLLKMRSAYFVKEYRRAAKNYPRTKLNAIFALLAEYDLRIKGVNNKSVNSDELLKELVFKILH